MNDKTMTDVPDLRTLERTLQSLANTEEPAALREAQECIYDAWETDDPDERIALARRALEISPDCADAWNLLAEEEARSLEEMMECYQRAMAAGERALGEETFERDKGMFWGLLETRPYMRARLGLARCLWSLGERDAALDHYRAMLELNPNDNQGIRSLLLSGLLVQERNEEAEQLLAAYRDDIGADWAYSAALLAFRREGDSPASRERRREALEANLYVPAYLSGRRKLPRFLPEYVGIGDKNEAVAYVFDAREAWRKTRGAIPWLLKGGKGKR